MIAQCVAGLFMTILLTARLAAQEGRSPDADMKSSALSSGPENTTDEIEAALAYPRDVVGLLDNLKIAVDRGFPLQASFGSDAVLKKAFAGSSIKHRTFQGGSETLIEVEDPHFPRMTVTLRQGSEEKATSSGGVQRSRRFALLEIAAAEVPGFDVCAVRDVFGQRATMSIDRGVDPHGVSYVADRKGDLVYSYGREGDSEGVMESPVAHVTRYEEREVDFIIKRTPFNPLLLMPHPQPAIRNRDEVEAVKVFIREQ